MRVLVAERCHLCDAAVEVVERVHAETAFDLEIVSITGDPAHESRYRAEIPVVEIDGERSFTYFVQADVLRRRISEHTPGSGA